MPASGRQLLVFFFLLDRHDAIGGKIFGPPDGGLYPGSAGGREAAGQGTRFLSPDRGSLWSRSGTGNTGPRVACPRGGPKVLPMFSTVRPLAGLVVGPRGCD